ncbi:hypothetical protein GUITHDRAFT_132307 [Guillardia theta CCMP2712]|uniref:C2 domain-containing protein n=1 Tax=Guillardia theta (strain CCMP2712) TaxID=905079 RepID=L1K207_GUITC|nr:hypothetical protein GUITHDRAFT_132307 [Guillardia theta CCMP2712]EKX54614.1 hypothetical protein GUITHDRAFT_132307 [Guillardia theta CCMP2712]|eukprot:XP_005841594.1 hypothetical protein GUITHDRAFT_132307 [Guillardia theta CCMP2712]
MTPAANADPSANGIPVSIFQQTVTVIFSMPAGSQCSLLCFSSQYVLQTGIQAPDLPALPIDCGGAPCGNPQNDCVDISKKSHSLIAFSTSSFIRGRLYNLAYKLVSPQSTIKYVNSLDLVSQVRCGDGITVNIKYDKAATINQEQCDDGNTRPNDGCDSSCNIEPGWTCHPASNTSSLAVCTPPDSYPNSTKVNEMAVFTRLGVPMVVTFGMLILALILWKRYPQAYHKCLRKYASAGLEVKDEDEFSSKRLTFKERKELVNGKMCHGMSSEMWFQKEKERMKSENRLEEAKRIKSRLMNWNLRLTIIEARNLPKADVFFRDSQMCGLADPYVTVKIDGDGRKDKKTYRTEICKSTLCPYWNKEISLQFDEEEDQVVMDVWDWDAGKNDDWLGVVRLTGNYMISGWQWGPAEGRSGSGGQQNAYEEDAWFALVDRKGRPVRNVESKRAAELHLKFRIDKTHDPVAIVEGLMNYKAEQKKKEQDHVIEARQVLISLQRYCGKNNLNVDMLAAKMDEDGSGSLDKEELLVGLNRIGFEISMEKIKNIFLMYSKQRMLDEFGNIPTAKFCDSIGVSTSGGLVQAMKEHVRLGTGQLHKLQEANCEAFHTGKTHPAWWEGCTCADQWICGKCGTWHQHGKRVWSWKGEFLEDAQCRECKEPRPDPLPKVPCKFLVQEDYFRIAGNKPAEKMNFGQKDSLIIRIQDEERLQIYDEPTWKLGYKIQNLESKGGNIHSDMEVEKVHINRESISMSTNDDGRKKSKTNKYVLPDGTWADVHQSACPAIPEAPQKLSEVSDDHRDELGGRPDTPEIDDMFKVMYLDKEDKGKDGWTSHEEGLLSSLSGSTGVKVPPIANTFKSISVDLVTASPQQNSSRDLTSGQEKFDIHTDEQQLKSSLIAPQSLQIFTHRMDVSDDMTSRKHDRSEVPPLEQHTLRELLKMRRENIREQVMSQRIEKNTSQQRDQELEEKSVKISFNDSEMIIEQNNNRGCKDTEADAETKFQSLSQLMIAATRSVRSQKGMTSVVPTSRNQAFLWAEKIVINPTQSDLEDDSARDIILTNHVSVLGGEGNMRGYNKGLRLRKESDEVLVTLITRPRSLGGGAYGIMFDLRARRNMMVRGLYSGCGLEEACEVKTKGVCIMTSRPRGVAVREGQKVLPGRVCVGSRETCTAEEKEGAGETRRVKEGLELLGGSLVTSPFLFSQTPKVKAQMAGAMMKGLGWGRETRTTRSELEGEWGHGWGKGNQKRKEMAVVDMVNIRGTRRTTRQEKDERSKRTIDQGEAEDGGEKILALLSSWSELDGENESRGGTIARRLSTGFYPSAEISIPSPTRDWANRIKLKHHLATNKRFMEVRVEDNSIVHAQSAPIETFVVARSRIDAMQMEINRMKLREIRYLQQIQDLRGVAARVLSSSNPSTPRTGSQ